MTLILNRTIIFAFWTFVRFMLIIGIGLIYCELSEIPFPERLTDDIRMLVYRVIPATSAGHAAALLLLWTRRGTDAIMSSKQSGLAALLCAVFLDSAFLFGTPFMSGMVLRRSVQLACAFVLTLAIGLIFVTKASAVPVEPLVNEPTPG